MFVVEPIPDNVSASPACLETMKAPEAPQNNTAQSLSTSMCVNSCSAEVELVILGMTGKSTVRLGPVKVSGDVLEIRMLALK